MPTLREEVESLSHKELQDLAAKMFCLEKSGVDNWEWYGESLDDGGYYEYVEEDNQ